MAGTRLASVNGTGPATDVPVSDLAAAQARINAEWRLLREQFVAGRISEAAYEAGSLALARREGVLLGMA